MATKNFKGFQLVALATFNGSGFTKDKDTLYFVRTSGEKNSGTDGFLYFNGKKYGTGEDVITKYGELNGKTISAYVADEIAKVTTTAGELGKKVDANTKAITAINGKIDTINGEANVDGSIKKAVADAKAAVVGTDEDASTADTIKGAKTGVKEAKDAAAAAQIAADAKVKSVEGTDTVVATTTEHAVKVSLKTNNDGGNVKFTQDEKGLSANVTIPDATVKGVTNGDKVISLGTDGKLSSTISLSVDATAGTDGKKYIHLNGIGGADLGKIDIADFVKDGMLDSASLATNPVGQPAGTYIVLTWNTNSGKKDPMYINVTSLIDVYTAKVDGGLKLEEHAFSVDTTKIATVDSVNGVTGRVTTLESKVGSAAIEGGAAASGLFKDVADNKKAIEDEAKAARAAETANKGAIDKLNATHAKVGGEGADKENFKTVAKEVTDGITGIAEVSKASAEGVADVKVTVTTKSGSVTAVAVDSSELARKVMANTTAITEEATRAKEAEKTNADAISALDKKITDGAVTLEVNDNDKYLGVSSATTTDKGIVYTLASKATEIDKAISDAVDGKNVAAEGESGETALVTASAGGNKVTVATTQKLKDAVAKAETSVQSVNGKASSAVTLTGADIATNQNVGESANATVNAVLADIYSKIGKVQVSSKEKTITVDETGRIIDVHRQTVPAAQEAGHVALEHGEDGALYGVMYYSGDDAE